MEDLIRQIAYLVWAGTTADIEELLNSEVENCTRAKSAVIEGRREWLAEHGLLEGGLAPLEVDQLAELRASGKGYDWRPGDIYAKHAPPAPTGNSTRKRK